MKQVGKHTIKTLAISLLFLSNSMSYAENIDVTFLYIGDTNGSAYQGVQQGLSEANLQGQFLGQHYDVLVGNVGDLDNAIPSSVIAVIAAGNKNSLETIGSKMPNTAILNITLDDDDLRIGCSANQLHILPSAQMKADALAQWQQKKPDSNASAQAWNVDFVKFAARDLNKRFKKAQKSEMNDEAWAGWAAIKMVSDTVARENLTNAGDMLEFLKTNLSFDGQKGINMDFRNTGQLRQPVLIVENGKTIAEAPVRGIAKPPTVESLGLTDCLK